MRMLWSSLFALTLFASGFRSRAANERPRDRALRSLWGSERRWGQLNELLWRRGRHLGRLRYPVAPPVV